MSVFAESGIQFSIITPDRTAEVCSIVAQYFFPDEPMCRSIGVEQTSFSDSYIGAAIKGGSCVMATDSYGQIIGVRLTEVIEKGSWFRWLYDKSFASFMPSLGRIAWLLGKPVLQKTCEVIPALFCQTNYDVWAFLMSLVVRKYSVTFLLLLQRRHELKALELNW